MARGMQITVAANFVAEPIRESLAYWFQELGLDCTLDFVPPDQIIQFLLRPPDQSDGESDFVILLIQIERWLNSNNGRQISFLNYEDLINALEARINRSSAKAFLGIACPVSPHLRDSQTISQNAEELRKRFMSILGVDFVTTQELVRYYLTDHYEAYFDNYTDRLAQMPYSRLGFAAIGTMLVRRLYAHIREPRKVIVVDCDNTLWEGLCGNSARKGVVIAERHRALQRFLISQVCCGRLICLCSKNMHADVFDVFDSHPDMLLRRNHLTSWKINWSPKTENLRLLASELGFALGAFIFIDDDVFECACVRAIYPEILTLQPPSDASELVKFLENVWDFDAISVTRDDRRRSALYRENAQREWALSEASALDTFLASLQLSVDITPLTLAEITRASQLISRTNQFNLNGIRYSALRLKTALDTCTGWVISARDRFGDYGLIGVIIYSHTGVALRIESLVLSCRALGKGIERRVGAFLIETGRSVGANKLVFAYCVTARNSPIHLFLTELGASEHQGEWTLTL